MVVEVNYLAILVAGIAAMVLGAIWYGPIFGKTWMKLMGFTQKDLEKAKQKGMALPYLLNFVSALVMAFVLAHMLKLLNAETIQGALQATSWIWLGFIATVTLGTVLWEGKPFGLYVLNNVYNLLSLFAMSAILVYWP